ncbi:hypothetical protein PVAP13_5KG460400 [Panicum virgatum]|uniref:Glycosyltransferase n=1 Tax=Panicum virgatum TaxID=38727 RepID=A0A8T0SSQ3_PANVG|nr:hypothetical protein PVAP13_5KG460400 [Panicum virgatum]
MAQAHAGAHSPHVVVLTSPGAGHHGVTATIVTFTNLSSPEHSWALATLPAGVSVAKLPETPLDDLPPDAHLVTRIVTVARRTLPHLRELLRSLLGSPAGVAAFLTDMLCAAALAAAEELGVPRYVFYPTITLVSLSSVLHAPELSRTTAGECRDLPEPVRLPGCVPLRGAELLEPLQDLASPAYALVVDYLRADGFVVNTFDGLEHDTLAAFQDLGDKGVYPPAYAVGPFVRSCPEEAAKHRCVEWLDGQPDGSVLYVCFGSGGAFSSRQTAELAAGLEASGQRFLWVVHVPSDKDSSAGYFGTASRGEDDPLSYLPEGFVERTGGMGLAVGQSAPQVEILNHRAVGGFLSHCGWNSSLEAVAAGVPILAWPLFAEQRTNAVMLSSPEGAGVALRLRAREDADGVVPWEEVAAAARELMAGEKGAAARKKANELRAGAEKAVAPDGPACRALAAVVDTWNGGSAPAAASLADEAVVVSCVKLV